MMKKIEKRRLVYVGPVGAGVLGAAASLPIAGLSLAFGQVDDVQNAMMGVVGTAVSCVLGAWLFNILGPMFGGLHIWLAAPARPKNNALRPAATRACPKCGAEAPASQSFCAECDHDFERDAERGQSE